MNRRSVSIVLALTALFLMASPQPLLAQQQCIGIPSAATGLSITQPGCYYLTQNILWPISAISINSSNVYLDLNGWTVELTGPGVGIIASGDNITVRNGTIVGTSSDAVTVVGGSGVVLEDLEISGSGQFAISGQMDNFTIRRNTITDCQGGIFVVASGPQASGTITENQLISTGTGIEVNAGGAVTIADNVIRRTFLSIFLADSGIRASGSSAVQILRNTVQSTLGNGIEVEDSGGCAIRDNVVALAGAAGIAALDSDECSILDNLARGSGTDGLLVKGNRHYVDGNVLMSNGSSGVGFGLNLAGVSQDGVYRRNTARANPGGVCAGPTTNDFCDETGLNTDGGNNFMP